MWHHWTLSNRHLCPKDHGLELPEGLSSKESPNKAGDVGLIPALGRSPAEGNGYLLQYSWESHGQRSLAGHSPRNCRRLGMTQQLNTEGRGGQKPHIGSFLKAPQGRLSVCFGRWHFPSPLPSNGLEIHNCELCWSNGKSRCCFSTEASINQAARR